MTQALLDCGRTHRVIARTFRGFLPKIRSNLKEEQRIVTHLYARDCFVAATFTQTGGSIPAPRNDCKKGIINEPTRRVTPSEPTALLAGQTIASLREVFGDLCRKFEAISKKSNALEQTLTTRDCFVAATLTQATCSTPAPRNDGEKGVT